MRVLVACEFSGVVRRAFRTRGHNAWSCDLRPAEDGDPHHIQGDVLKALRDGWDLMVAHPPCTRLTNAGVRWLKVPPPGRTLEEMWRDLGDGVRLYRALREAPIPRIAMENPIMHFYARALIRVGKRQVVQPWWFGDPFFKATGFELIGLPQLVATKRLTPPEPGTAEHKAWSAVHRESPGEEREKNRSRFYPGMADAMAAQWGDYVDWMLECGPALSGDNGIIDRFQPDFDRLELAR